MGTNRIDSRAQLADLHAKYGIEPVASIQECLCGAVVTTYADGTVYDGWRHLRENTTRHSCIGTMARRIANQPPTVVALPRPAPRALVGGEGIEI